MKEIWKDIPNYEGLYQVSNYGRVKSLDYNHTKKEKILRANYDKRGYETLELRKNGERGFYRIHRLVAQTFIPNPDNLPQVNHKDENKLNNCVDNLEWCTNDYNAHYGTHYERIRNKLYKPVNQYDKEGNFIKTYSSITEAEKENKTTHISSVCNNIRKSAGGYIWKYN